MGFEVDFLPVGQGERGGDAIAVRFGDLHGRRNDQFVMVIDGGTKDSGQALVDLILQHYKTEQVDLVVSTHPDDDHVSGLRVVLDQLSVGRLWMHRPWNHASDFRALFKERRLTSIGLKKAVRRALDTACEVEELALSKGIPIDEPFSDYSLPFGDIGIQVLGPSSGLYQELLPHFRETPDPATGAGLFRTAVSAVQEAVRWLAESWLIETLQDPADDASSAENNTSVILSLSWDNRLLLFTGDAGVLALREAANEASTRGIDLQATTFVQVPHHGSRRNVGPTVLDQILGVKYQVPENARSAFVSAAPKGEPKHPSRRVTNAIQRRGAKDRVYATQGSPLVHRHEAPDRSGYSAATPVPFYDQVEE